MNLKEICQFFNTPCDSNQEITGFSVDSRTTKDGELFIAIKGENFDGHNFVAAAANKAVAVIVEHKIPNVIKPQIVVPNTLQAMTDLAKFHRLNMPCQIIALTGSNGKTTVKEMIAAILPPPSLATLGNFNNHIGVPLSVLRLEHQHRYAVFELGASGMREIAHLVDIVKPQVALINNIAPAHIEGFGSIDNVARAKGEIFQGLDATGTAIVNDDDDYAHFWDADIQNKKVIRFSRQKSTTEVYARNISFNANNEASFYLVTPKGEIAINLKVPGYHNVSNALAAAACTLALEIPLETIAMGLEKFGGVAGRMTIRAGKNNSIIIDDTYNANLRSSLSALEVLAQRQGQKIFVFGDMAELGNSSEQHHEEVGLAAKNHGIDIIMTHGKYSQATSKAFGDGKHYNSKEDLINDLLQKLNANTTVLIKGSRSSAMEKVVQQLINEGC